MSDVPENRLPPVVNTPATPVATTAGGLLRQARQAQGLHIAALAAAIKVTPRKLESLEADRFNELPDATFTRALAQAVCRTLKVDAAPVLALLPPPNGHRLEQVAEGLNTPFRERPGRLAPKEWAQISAVAIWVPVLLLLAAAAIYLMPAGWLSLPQSSTTAGADSPASAASSVSELIPSVVSSAASMITAPAETSAAASAAEAAPAAAAPAASSVEFRASAESWIDVTDARGQSLMSRVIKPGEVIGLDGAMPMKVKIGNARVTQLTLRGQPFDLAPSTRDNVARLELK